MCLNLPGGLRAQENAREPDGGGGADTGGASVAGAQIKKHAKNARFARFAALAQGLSHSLSGRVISLAE